MTEKKLPSTNLLPSAMLAQVLELGGLSLGLPHEWTGTQSLEPSPAASQSLHHQKAGTGSQNWDMNLGTPTGYRHANQCLNCKAKHLPRD